MRRLWGAYQQLGEPFRLDLNAGDQRGHTVVQTTSAGGERWSTHRSYLQPAMARANLHVLTFTTARRVLFDNNTAASGPRAVAVEFQDAAGQVRPQQT